MKRTQHISFTEEEAKILEKGMEIASQFADKRITVNNFVRKNAVLRAKKINEGDKNA